MAPQQVLSVSTPQPALLDTDAIYDVIDQVQARQPWALSLIEPTTPRSPSHRAPSYCSSDDSSSTSITDGRSIFTDQTSAHTQATSMASDPDAGQLDGASSFWTQTQTQTQTSAITLPTPTERSTRDDEGDGVEPLSEVVRLPCEYAKYSEKYWKCDETFTLDDIEGWTAHIAETHFKYNYPPKSICWFCDGNDSVFFTDSVNQNDREANFRRRMRHIAGHYRQANWERLHRRPDFFVLDFLVEQDLVNQSMKEELEGWSELQKPKWWQDEPPKTLNERREVGWAVTNQTLRRGRRERPQRGYYT